MFETGIGSYLMNPEFSVSLHNLSGIMFATTATLLGIVVAVIPFFLQTIADKFCGSKGLQKPIVINQGRLIINYFSGASLVSLCSLFSAPGWASFMFYFFSAAILIGILKYTAAAGLFFVTHLHGKSVPEEFGPARKLIRKIIETGSGSMIKIAVALLVVILWPILITFSNGNVFLLTEDALVVFLLGCAGFGVYELRVLIMYYFEVVAASD